MGSRHTRFHAGAPELPGLNTVSPVYAVAPRGQGFDGGTVEKEEGLLESPSSQRSLDRRSSAAPHHDAACSRLTPPGTDQG